MNQAEVCAELKKLYDMAIEQKEISLAITLLERRTASGPICNFDELVMTAIGEASMCWSETPKGVFDSGKAKKIGEELLKTLKEK